MNEVTRKYNESCRAPGGGLSRVVRRVERDPSLRHGGHRCTLSRPLFVDSAEIAGFGADLRRMLELLTSLPERVFDGDLDRFCAALGVEPSRAALMSRFGGRPPQFVGRADVHRDEQGYKILEFGIGSELGGWIFAGDLPRAMLEADEFAAFAAANRLDFVDTGQELAAALREASGVAEPVVALVEASGALSTWGDTWLLMQQGMQKLGVDFHVGELRDITERNGRIMLGQVPVDVVYRVFEAADVCHEAEEIARVELIAKAHEDGRVVLWTPMEANLYGEKGCLALLSDPSWGGAFTAEERALIDRMLPWTRSLNRGSTVDVQRLVEECRNRREELILKPNSMYGGIGVVAGWEATPDQWWTALRHGVANGAIVQERVTAVPDVVVNPETGEEERWRTLWGPFYTPRGYAGARCWMVREDGPAVIGLAQGKEVLAAGVFHCDNSTS
ncbi:hypothetical protein [Lentzea sp. NPDC004782]|uniref:hypothetical protein n=1 Tax=Lentzea sp. NPDC004782 TaxID=3154458 RepID=UPI0033A658F7